MDNTVEFSDPKGNRIQFYCDMDQVGWDDQSGPPSHWRRQEALQKVGTLAQQ